MTDLSSNISETNQTKTYAAVDLGSNSFHMVIATETLGQIKIIDKHKEMVRLRSGLDQDGNLTAKAYEKAINCLSRFGQRIKNIPPRQVRAVGTNTLRNAKNAEKFLTEARKVLGHEIQIIAGQEEARLIYTGVVKGLPKSNETRLIMDIGGGSTEYIVGQNFDQKHLTSTEMGCVSMTQAFFRNNQVEPHTLEKAIAHCRQILRPHKMNLLSNQWDIAYGASGSIKAIGHILSVNGWSEKGITRQGLYQLRDQLIDAKNVDYANINGLKEDRIPVLLGGLVILIATFEELPIKVMHVSQHALREGLIYDTLGRMSDQDTREVSVKAMQTWTDVNTQQAEQVAQTALQIYRQVHNLWDLHHPDHSYKQLLRWAAMLHECGIAVSYKRYRHHSAYLIENAELAGFSQIEKQMLSALILNHRGKFIEKAFDSLPTPHNKKLVYLLLALRLAVRIHRGREVQKIDLLLRVINDKQIDIEFEENWLENHPLTKLDLEIEADRLAGAGYQLSMH